MNRAIASVYAITITHEGYPVTDKQKLAAFDCIPVLIAEIERLDPLARIGLKFIELNELTSSKASP